ncbi:MAG TPA: hypothetical protein VEG65_07855 [Candidatus Bathyarchaeia archaeon]|nr:hypothetical protein [Candidatus Bathyarchaeia archaeon]
MDAALAFGILWVISAILIAILSDKWSTLSLLALNLLIAGFLFTENDIIGGLVKAALGIVAPIIILLAVARTREPNRRFGTLPLLVMTFLTLTLSFAVAFSMRSQFPVNRVTESYALIMLFGTALLSLVSQGSILKLVLGILILENIATLIIAWGENTALLAIVAEMFVVLITLTITWIALLDFAEYDSIDASKLTDLRG